MTLALPLYVLRRRAARLRLLPAVVLISIVSLLASGGPGWAQRGGMSVIRDAEIEHTIQVYATPLFQAAGLSPSGIDVYLIDDDSLNAFVTQGAQMFLHTGLLMASETPLQTIGVIAHETGHLAGGHYIGRRDEIETAGLTAAASNLLAILAGIASGDGRVAAAVARGGQDIALRNLLAFTRGQEQAADQAAVQYLTSSQLSPEGLLDFFRILEDQEVLLSSSQDPYLRTHPLTSDRISFLEQAVARSPYRDRPAPEALQEMHQRMRAKLVGFLGTPQEVYRMFPQDDESLPARYAHAITKFKQGFLEEALPILDGLIAERPDDPFFHELRGQMLLENQRVAEALPEYEKAVGLRPRDPQLRLRLAQVQVELGTERTYRDALDNLTAVLARTPNDATAWRLSAIAHGRLGNEGMTALSLAEYNYARRDWRDAAGQARKAKELLDEGSPGWLRAADLLNVAEREFERERERQ
jgi:predicted Zn-dependent protease